MSVYSWVIELIEEMKKQNIKAVFFDMDGVLFDSMKNHSEAWHKVMKDNGFTLSREEAYMHEGRTASSTINIVCNRELNRNATDEEVKRIYEQKTNVFNSLPEAKQISGVYDLLKRVKKDGMKIVLVTGSGQRALLDRLEKNFPSMFTKELMVTAYDVKNGKPNPEPYLTALSKAEVKPDEAIVIENAPLGVESSSKAGIFTIAVNTGPLPNEVLINSGADKLYSNMHELTRAWDNDELSL